MKDHLHDRLEYLRSQIRAERISYGEIAELQSLAEYIEPGDVELAEWAGIPEDEFHARGAIKNADPRYVPGVSEVDDDMTDEEWREALE